MVKPYSPNCNNIKLHLHIWLIGWRPTTTWYFYSPVVDFQSRSNFGYDTYEPTEFIHNQYLKKKKQRKEKEEKISTLKQVESYQSLTNFIFKI